MRRPLQPSAPPPSPLLLALAILSLGSAMLPLSASLPASAPTQGAGRGPAVGASGSVLLPPPPVTPPGGAGLSPHAGSSAHYYVGSIYNGPNTTSSRLSVELTVPSDVPQSSDFYYVLLSAWDDSGSYDQIGFANDYGVWGLAYSTTTVCAQSYSFTADAFNLSAGTSYTFAMSLAPGSIGFSAAPLGTAPIWSKAFTSSASTFVLATDYTCGGSTSADYTNYEEVYQSAAPEPPYEFGFAANADGLGSVSTWVSFTALGPPAAIAVSVAGAATEIENEPFAFTPVPSLGSELSGSARSFATNASLVALNGSSTVTLQLSGAVRNSTLSLSKGSGTTGLVVEVILNLSTTSAAGTYTLELTATGPGGAVARGEVPVEVATRLAAGAVGATPSAVDVGQKLKLGLTLSGGVGPFSLAWTGVNASDCSLSLPSPVCAFARAGVVTIGATVTDALGFRSMAAALAVNVSPALDVSGHLSSDSVDVGQSVVLSVTASGGSGGTRILWAPSEPAACASTPSNLTCVPIGPGELTIQAEATDANGAIVQLPLATISVFDDPNASASASAPEIDVGMTVTFSANVTGGSGGFLWQWIDLPGRCGNASAPSVTCRANASDLFPVVVEVTDSNGLTVASHPVVVAIEPAPSVRLAASSTDLLEGQGLSMAASPDGGVAPYRFTWAGLPSGCAAPPEATLACRPADPGNYNVSVVVRDAVGALSNASLTVTVAPSFAGLPATEGYALLGGSILAIALVVAVVALTGRRRATPPGRPGSRKAPTPRRPAPPPR